MRVARTLAAGAFIAGAASVLATVGAGSAGAVAVTPMPDVGGVRVDLSPADTQWVHNSNFGHMLAAIPHPSAPSFGMALDAAAAVSAAQPNGRVVFTVFGPLHELNGSMLAVQ